RERMVAVAERSLRILIMLSLPMAAGLALTARSLVSALYGNGYGPTAVVLEILAVTLVPVYIATLLGTVMVTNDRQNAWTWMTAGLAVANIGLNLILIPSFHRVGQHGGHAAATAVLEVLKQVLSRTAARMTWRRRLARVESG